MFFPDGRPMSLTHSAVGKMLVGENLWNTSLVFSALREEPEEPEPGWIRERLQPKVTEEGFQVRDRLSLKFVIASRSESLRSRVFGHSLHGWAQNGAATNYKMNRQRIKQRTDDWYGWLGQLIQTAGSDACADTRKGRGCCFVLRQASPPSLTGSLNASHVWVKSGGHGGIVPRQADQLPQELARHILAGIHRHTHKHTHLTTASLSL